MTSIPTVIGVAEGVSEQRKQNQAKADEKRMAKFYLDVFCEDEPEEVKNVHGKRVVLRNNKACLSMLRELNRRGRLGCVGAQPC